MKDSMASKSYSCLSKEVTESDYAKNIDHFIRQMPGFAAWKTPDSVYASANLLCAQLAGYGSIESYIGTTDYEWKCEAVKFAEDIRNQDKIVLGTRKEWQSFNILKFSRSVIYYFSHKTVIINPANQVIGVMFLGTILSDAAIVRSLRSLAANNPKDRFDKIQCSIFSIVDESNSELALSQRQHECLFYLLRGKTAKEIGTALNISSRTVETYIENIKDKFQCTNRKELFEKAIELGCYYRIPSSLLKQEGLISKF